MLQQPTSISDPLLQLGMEPQSDLFSADPQFAPFASSDLMYDISAQLPLLTPFSGPLSADDSDSTHRTDSDSSEGVAGSLSYIDYSPPPPSGSTSLMSQLTGTSVANHTSATGALLDITLSRNLQSQPLMMKYDMSPAVATNRGPAVSTNHSIVKYDVATVVGSQPAYHTQTRRSSPSSAATSIAGQQFPPAGKVAPEDAEETLRRRRLARKAELARLSRKRKKEMLGTLEIEVADLQNQVERLKKQRKLDEDVIRRLRAQQGAPASTKLPVRVTELNETVSHVQTAFKMITNAARSEEAALTQNRLSKLIDNFGEVLNNEKSARVANPAPTTTVPLPLLFLQWAMSQPAQFYAQTDGLWSGLFNQIGYSPNQMADLMKMRIQMREQKTMHEQLVARAHSLQEATKEFQELISKNFRAIRGVFTERQLANFFVWCETNQLCVKMLTSASVPATHGAQA
eukprot:306214_1